MNRIGKSIAALACSVFLSSCLTVTADKLAKVTPDQIQTKGAPRVKMFTRWAGNIANAHDKELVDVIEGSIHKYKFEKLVRSLGCCLVVEGPTEADVIIDAKVNGEQKPLALFFAVLTGVSLYILPSWIHSELDWEVQVTAKGASQSYKLFDSLLLVQWLPLVVAVPFHDTPAELEQKMVENAYLNLLLKMKQDGFLGTMNNT